MQQLCVLQKKSIHIQVFLIDLKLIYKKHFIKKQ